MPLADVSQTYTDLVTSVFSSPIAAKAWLATAALVLAFVQVTTAARIFGKLSVFFHCVMILGFQTPDIRVAAHSLVGTFFYGVFAAKVLIVRDRSLPGWALPVAGASLASILGLLWLTSSLWYFTNVRFGF